MGGPMQRDPGAMKALADYIATERPRFGHNLPPMPVCAWFQAPAGGHDEVFHVEAQPARLGTLVALTSPAMASGKSEVAKVLIARGFEPVKFAGTLKAMTRTFLSHGLGIDDPQRIERLVEGDLKEEMLAGLGGVTTRHLMQTLGTDWRLLIAEDLWAKMVAIKVGAMLNAGISVVIDDMRFPVELDAVQSLGGHAVRVVRPGTVPTNGHASEGQLDAWEMPTIVNDSSLRVLKARTEDLIDNLPGLRVSPPWHTTH